MEISIHNNWVGWNLLLRVNLSKTDAIAPPWTLKHVDWFQCIGSRVQVVGWTNLLWPENCTDVCISSAQQQQHTGHIPHCKRQWGPTVCTVHWTELHSHTVLCGLCTVHWVPFTHCALWPVANQGNHPLCACLLHCSLSPTHISVNVESIVGMLWFVMKWALVSLENYLYANVIMCLITVSQTLPCVLFHPIPCPVFTLLCFAFPTSNPVVVQWWRVAVCQ